MGKPRGKPRSGLLVHRASDQHRQVLLVHAGGPFWRDREVHSWSIPTGKHEPDADAYKAALRTFRDQLGVEPPIGEVTSLGSTRDGADRAVRVWAVLADLDVSVVRGETFILEWPRGSGQVRSFPRVDRAEWFDLDAAFEMLVARHVPFLDALLAAIDSASDAASSAR